MSSKRFTYVSLFSCAGIGCYGFKQAGWECLATCELKPSYMDIQRANKKCSANDQYICGDISLESTKQQLYTVVDSALVSCERGSLDVVMATPPCQGISLANHKKNNADFKRNSLVVDALRMIRHLSPKVFLLENVQRFLQTACLDGDEVKSINDAIFDHLGDDYDIHCQVANLKDYGSQSSRTRTIVIGVKRSLCDQSPGLKAEVLFPSRHPANSLWQVIGHLPELNEMGERWEANLWHTFRPYQPRMRSWIEDLVPGQSAFENVDPLRRPHRMIDGEYVPNANKNADKYRRVLPQDVAPCVHTRNDILASQNTVHPYDDRVFSIAELMCMLTVPAEFRWTALDDAGIKSLSKREWTTLERTIRTVLGECVPTAFVLRFARQIETAFGASGNEPALTPLTENKAIAYTLRDLHVPLRSLMRKKRGRKRKLSSRAKLLSIECRDPDNWIEQSKAILDLVSDQQVLSWVIKLNIILDAAEPQTWTKLRKLVRHRDYAVGIHIRKGQTLLLGCLRECQLSPIDIGIDINQPFDLPKALDDLENTYHSLHQTEQWFQDRSSQLTELETVLEYLHLKPSLSRFHWRKLSLQIEELNPKRNQNEAFFTSADIAYDCVSWFKPIAEHFANSARRCRILEPSVGTGNILEQVLELCVSVEGLEADLLVVDIDPVMLDFVQLRVAAMKLPTRIQVHFRNEDFLLSKFDRVPVDDGMPVFDLVIGNPPFSKLRKGALEGLPFEPLTDDLFGLFWQKALTIAAHVSLITPRALIATPKYSAIRDRLLEHKLVQMFDFGQRAFSVNIETMNIALCVNRPLDVVRVCSWQDQGGTLCLPQEELWVDSLNGLVFFQDELFHRVLAKLRLGVFSVFRERTSTKSIEQKKGKYRLLGARDIGILEVLDRGEKNLFVDDISGLQSKRFLNLPSVFLAPNGTYYPRVAKLPKNAVMTGGAAVLLPVEEREMWDLQLEYLGSAEFTAFFNRCWNFAQRSLNIDAHSVRFWGELIQADKQRAQFYECLIAKLPDECFLWSSSQSLELDQLFQDILDFNHEIQNDDNLSFDDNGLFSPRRQLLSILLLDGADSLIKKQMINSLWKHISQDVFAIELWVKTLKKYHPDLPISFEFGPNILANETAKFSNLKALFNTVVCDSRYSCYPENYFQANTDPEFSQKFINQVVLQLKLIQEDCYENQGRQLSLARYVDLLTHAGMPAPQHLSFDSTMDAICDFWGDSEEL